MAERKVTAKSIFLFIDLAGGTDYKTLICLTANSQKRATSIIDAASFCGPDSQPGQQTVSVDFAGQRMLDPTVDHITSADLVAAWQDSRTIGWKLAPAVPVDGDVIYAGTGFISSLNDTNDMSNTTFDGTIAVSGYPTKTVYPAS